MLEKRRDKPGDLVAIGLDLHGACSPSSAPGCRASKSLMTAAVG
jgi:hypothetical protein